MNSVAKIPIAHAMRESTHIIERAAADHLQAFSLQMREKVGVDEIALSEPYLPFALARGELELLRRLEKLERRLDSRKALEITIYGSYRNRDDIDEEEEDDEEEDDTDDEIASLIDTETNRSLIHFKQELDSWRQQSFGIRHYLWEGGDCPLCAPNNGQIFAWGEGDEPGDVHPNCNCSADPVLDDAGDSATPNISDDHLLEMALLLASLTPAGLARRLGVSAVTKLGKIGQRILQSVRRRDQEKPPESQKPTYLKPDNLNARQRKNLERFERKLPRGAKETKIIQHSNGTITYQSDVPATNILGSYARYEKIVDASGNTISYTKTTYGPNGEIIHIKDKLGGIP